MGYAVEPEQHEFDSDLFFVPLDLASTQRLLHRFRKSSNRHASWQLVNTLVPYAALWIGMWLLSSVSWWLIPPLALLASGLQVRLFIIFHDCGHGSFFSSRRANEIVGFITATLTFVPAHYWWAEHARHHAHAGNLDKRGFGDVWTLTVREYLESSRWRRFSYQLVRNPVVLLTLAPVYLFLVRYRFAGRVATSRERRSVLLGNLAIFTTACALIWWLGLVPYLLIQGSVLLLSATAGVWLFYVQHQFEDVYWERAEQWSYSSAALRGSSYYKLPRILQWFTGNIGFHHIHHLNPGIPNYNLERCHCADPEFAQVPTLTLLKSLRSLRLKLWDEQRQRLVRYPVERQAAMGGDSAG